MNHRNHKQMLKNAHQAIPDFDEPALPVSQIHRKQASPRLPVDELLEMLGKLVESGDVVKTVEKNEANSRMVDVYRFLK